MSRRTRRGPGVGSPDLDKTGAGRLTVRSQTTSDSPTARYLQGRAAPLDDVFGRLAALEEAVFGDPESFDWPHRPLTYEEVYGDDQVAG